MELKCTNCGSIILAENINIQKTLAVCAECNHVFDFSNMMLARKAKKRPPKKPERLHVQDVGEQLKLSYRLALSPGAKFGFLMCTIGSIIVPILLISASNEPIPPKTSFFLFFGMIMLAFWYTMAVFLTTKTDIIAAEDALIVKTGPLPFPIKDDKIVDRHDINRVFSKETMEWPPGMPSHNVCMELSDGQEKSLVTALPQEYAFYITRKLDDYLQSGEEVDVIESGDEFYDDSVDQNDNHEELTNLIDAEDKTQSASS